MDNIERLKIFCLVADHQSFAQVAKHLCLPRSTVTYAIQALEKEYEILLFYRTTRKVSLTYEGSLFYEEATQLIQHLKELNRFKYQMRNQQGKITIGLPMRMATQTLIPQLSTYYAQYPSVKVHVKGCDEYSNLIEQQLDCVVRIGEVRDTYLIAKQIGFTRLCTVAAPSYIEKNGYPSDQDELNTHYAVEYFVGKNQKNKSELIFNTQQLKLSYRVIVEDTESYIQAGLSGLGIIQIPDFDASQYLKTGALIELFKEVEASKIPIHFLRTDRKFRPKYLQDFMTWFEVVLKQTQL